MKIIELPTESGDLVRFEVTESHAGSAPTRGGGDAGIITKAKESVESAVAAIRPAVDAISKSLRDFNSPDEIELEFGFKVTAEVGAVIASSSSEAHFRVALKWSSGKDLNRDA